jgi:aerobic-type carbon monoxide dehydrogenase small subunit (CoxS/CutS family)
VISGAGRAAGHQVTTVEGLAEDGLLDPVQQASPTTTTGTAPMTPALPAH